MFRIKEKPEDFIVNEIIDLEIKKDGTFCYLILEKKNISTIDAINIISKHFNMPSREIGFAGLKDKNAITRQYISIPAKYYSVEKYKSFFSQKIKLEFLGRSNKHIYIGSNKKNSFEITVRNIEQEIKNDIFIDKSINYFDEQRFSKNNILIGKFILKKNFKDAASLIAEDEQYSKLIKKHLADVNKDYVGALRKLDKNLLKMFIHSYQSHIWNKVVSEYLKNTYPEHYLQKYSNGEFCFPKENIVDMEVPLPGFDLDSRSIRDKKLYQIYEKVLLEENILPRDFIIRELPDVSCEGGKRSIIMKIENFNFSVKDDEINKDKKKIIFKFTLDKGSYATIVIRNAMLKILDSISDS